MDLRKDMPYCGYETFDFDVPTRTEGDAYARYRVRIDEMRESLKIVEQALERLGETPGPVMIEDPKVGWQSRLSVGPDGIGNDPAFLAAHHGGVDGGADPPLQDGDAGRRRCPPARCTAASRRRAASSACTWCPTATIGPTGCRIRDPSFVNLQALPDVIEGYLVADIIAAVSSLDPVMGGVDR